MNDFTKHCIPCKQPLMDIKYDCIHRRYVATCLKNSCPISKNIHMLPVTEDEVELFEAQIKKK